VEVVDGDGDADGGARGRTGESADGGASGARARTGKGRRVVFVFAFGLVSSFWVTTREGRDVVRWLRAGRS